MQGYVMKIMKKYREKMATLNYFVLKKVNFDRGFQEAIRNRSGPN